MEKIKNTEIAKKLLENVEYLNEYYTYYELLDEIDKNRTIEQENEPCDTDELLKRLEESFKNEIKMFRQKIYQVIEDNGGGLTLAVFNENCDCEYLHGGYEYNIGQLTKDLESLKNGDDPKYDWEGNAENPIIAYDLLTGSDYGYKVIADNDGIYHDNMGSAGLLEFNLMEDEE